MHEVFIDADGCPVKREVYRVAARYGWKVWVVSGQHQHVPALRGVEAVVVGGDFDAADDWIAERAGAGDVVVTADIPLADRSLKAGARTLGPKGRRFTEDGIGDALASRALGEHLRQMGVQTGGPAPMAKKDRSRFLSCLDEEINAVLREGR